MQETPRERRYVKNKQRILDVAQNLIAKKGYENVSLREIARKADYSPAGLYEYFDSKDHILASLRGRINTLLIDSVQVIPKRKETAEQIIEMGLAYIRFAVENTEYFNLLNVLPPMRELQDSPDPTISPFLVFQKAVENLLVDWQIKPSTGFGPEEITYSFWTIIHGMATLQISHLKGLDVDFTENNRRILAMFTIGLKNHLKEK